MFLNAVLSIAVLLILPTAMGISLCGILKRDACSLTECFTFGTFGTWAIFHLIALPLIWLRASFSLLAILFSAACLFVILYGIIRYRYKPCRAGKLFANKYDIVLFSLMLLVFAAVLVLQNRFTNIDDDDSYFVVVAIDTLRTNTLYRVNTDTGELLAATAPFVRYATSPWGAYQAYLSKLTLLHPTILIHLVQPLALFLMAFEIQWRLSRHFAGETTRYRSLYCILLWLIMLYIGYNGWTAEGFLMKRLWQGKAVIAGIGVPYLLTALLDGYEGEIKTLFPVLLLINLGMCLPSNMGMLLGAFLTGVYGAVCGVRKKSLKTAVMLWLTAAPCIFFALLVPILT